MGRSNTIFKGKVSKVDFDKWDNNKSDCKLLFVGYDSNTWENPNAKQVAKFYTADEAKSIITSEPDYESIKNDSADIKEVYNYYGFYFNSDDFYDITSIEEDGTYDYNPITDKEGLLVVCLDI